MTNTIQVLTTTEKRKDAEHIARHLVERRLAACVQISPIQSVYRWQDAIETASEFQCSIKTTADLYQHVEAAVQEIHPYDVPEILAVPICEGSPAYLDWLRGQTRQVDAS